MNTKILMAFLCLMPFANLSAQDNPSLYGTGKWDADSLGNHRVVVSVDTKANAVVASLDWRRHDFSPEKKDIYVVDARTGQRVMNVTRFNITREHGDIVFQPTTIPGQYYIYYLKNILGGYKYYPEARYPEYQPTASAQWLKANKLTGTKVPKLPTAKLVQYQAINQLNSFYPMCLIATAAETKHLVDAKPNDKYLLFNEDRQYPIQMTTDLPARWTDETHQKTFTGTADKGEYYAFQLAVYAARDEVKKISVDFSALTNNATGDRIPASAFTCFNTEGTDVTGTSFVKNCSVAKGRVQPLWIGTMVPEKIPAGTYCGEITIKAENAESHTMPVVLTVSNQVIANHGDNEPWRHSRLRWLNSQLGFDDEVIAPYLPLTINDRKITCLGRDVTLDTFGFPAKIESFFDESMTKLSQTSREILASPIEMKADGSKWKNLSFEVTKKKQGAIAWKALNTNDRFLMDLEGEMEADGNITYHINLVATADGQVNDISLLTTLNSGIAKYMMGLGEKGGYRKPQIDWKWEVKKNQDAVWCGDVNAGIQLRFYDDKYVRPLNTNFYQQQPLVMPASWCNNGNGGIRIADNGSKQTEIAAYSGARTVKQGDKLSYFFNVLITPFRTIDSDKQWRQRYYHAYAFVDSVEAFGANVLNIHHATGINPFINYPFLRPMEMKAFIDGAHARNMKVKIYNTVRELSNSCTEIFALRSLGDEIFAKGKGGGFSWLQEHLDQDYIGAWFVPGLKDAAIVNSGVSRWHNYYIEGLDWLVKNVGIDGLYIDDLAFDRMTMKRVRKILNRTNPGALIDLHSANQFNPRDGFANSANLYLEHFPYLDRLWFGEYFDYNSSPDFWLIEVSGIPYGLMGEMLQDGGNRWRGMLYGMTSRSPWNGDNRAIWKFWNDFGIEGSDMIGYWVKGNPVKTGSEKTLATIYCHKGDRTLISLATWEDKDSEVTLTIDWKKLGLDPSRVTLKAPAIDGFQEAASWHPGDTIKVPKGKGLLIIVS